MATKSKKASVSKASPKASKKAEPMNCAQLARAMMGEYDAEEQIMRRVVIRVAKELGIKMGVGRGGIPMSPADQQRVRKAIAEKYVMVNE